MPAKVNPTIPAGAIMQPTAPAQTAPLAPQQTNGRLPIHALVYGDAGTFKSTFAATFPKPLLVWNFEGIGNDAPYFRTGFPGPLLVSEGGFYYRDVTGPDGELLVRVEYYHDPNEEEPSAWDRYRTRMATFPNEYSYWQTVVFESVDFADVACRNAQRFLYNPTTKEPRQWRAETTDQLENLLKMRFGGFPMNVVTVTGISEKQNEISGVFVRNPSAPGRLQKALSRAYAEVYHTYTVLKPDTTDEWIPQIQAQTGNGFVAKSTLVNAPNPCWPSYEALWANFDAAASANGTGGAGV